MLSCGFSWRIVKVIGMALVALCGCVTAGTIGPTGCLNNSCYGGQYSLDANFLQSSGQNSDWWRITFTSDLEGYNGPALGKHVASLAVKLVDSNSSIIGVDNISAPTSGTWDMVPGGASNNGCNGSGNGWLCLQYVAGTGSKMLVGPGTPIYTWAFDVNLQKGTLLSVASIKANFDPAAGVLMSEKIAVAEGFAGELPLLLLSLGAFAAIRKYGFAG